jgi:hypothetical protein
VTGTSVSHRLRQRSSARGSDNDQNEAGARPEYLLVEKRPAPRRTDLSAAAEIAANLLLLLGGRHGLGGDDVEAADAFADTRLHFTAQ